MFLLWPFLFIRRVIFFLFITVLFGALFRGIGRLFGGGAPRNLREAAVKQDPPEIAWDRSAKGEISKEQFEQIKKDLS